jgi:hypothetical protein
VTAFGGLEAPLVDEKEGRCADMAEECGMSSAPWCCTRTTAS